MRTGYFLILTFLLGNVFGCQGVAQNKNQTNQNQTNQKEVAAKDIPLKLRLNNEELGTTADTSVLSKKLDEIFKYRVKEGAFREGTNEVEKSVHLETDRSVSAEEIAKLFGVLSNSGASPILIPVKVPVKKNDFPRPNPLALYVYAGSGASRSMKPPEVTLDVNADSADADFTVGGIEIGFMEELSENNNGFPLEKDTIAVVVDKNGTYTMDGKQISAADLKIEIGNRLKTKEKNKKIIFVQAENYGNMEDVASIAAAANAVKVVFMTKKH